MNYPLQGMFYENKTGGAGKTYFSNLAWTNRPPRGTEFGFQSCVVAPLAGMTFFFFIECPATKMVDTTRRNPLKPFFLRSAF